MLIMLFGASNIALAGGMNTTVDSEKHAVFKEEKKAKKNKKKEDKIVEEDVIITKTDVVITQIDTVNDEKSINNAYPAALDNLSDKFYGDTRVINNSDIVATTGSKTVIVEDGITPKSNTYTIDDLLLEDDFVPYTSDETLLSTFSTEPSKWDSSAQFIPYRSNAEEDIYNLGTSAGLMNRYQIRAGYQKDYFLNSQKKASLRAAKLYNAYKNYGVSVRNTEDNVTMNTQVVPN